LLTIFIGFNIKETGNSAVYNNNFVLAAEVPREQNETQEYNS
jgi:hypothetical protein